MPKVARIGYDRADNFASPGGIFENESHVYALASPQLNQWSLSGDWTVRSENAVLNGVGGSIVYRFHARDLHLVLGPAADGKPIQFRVTIDGNAPGAPTPMRTDKASSTAHVCINLSDRTARLGPARSQLSSWIPELMPYTFAFG